MKPIHLTLWLNQLKQTKVDRKKRTLTNRCASHYSQQHSSRRHKRHDAYDLYRHICKHTVSPCAHVRAIQVPMWTVIKSKYKCESAWLIYVEQWCQQRSNSDALRHSSGRAEPNCLSNLIPGCFMALIVIGVPIITVANYSYICTSKHTTLNK